MHALEIEHLHKSFDGVPVLRGLSLAVPEGQVYGLLGPTGAGKSTLVNLVLGFLKPYRGTVRLLGAPHFDSVRRRVGYLPQHPRFHQRFTAREYLRYLGQFNDLPGATLSQRVDAELRVVGLLDVADRLISTYSKSMLARLNLAQALLNEPQLLIVDEPAAGLDSSSQSEILALLGSLRKRGVTMFITTQFVPEIEFVCDRLGVLHGGRVAVDLSGDALRAPGRDVLITVDALPAVLATQLAALSPAVRCTDRAVLLQPNSPALQTRVLRALLDASVAILALESQRRPLEDLFNRVVRGEHPELATPAPPNSIVAPPVSPIGLPQHPSPVITSPTTVQHAEGDDQLLRQLLSKDE